MENGATSTTSAQSSKGGGDDPHNDITIVHGDFRELGTTTTLEETTGTTGTSSGRSGSSTLEDRIGGRKKFDLITGTPPYFRVDFRIKNVDMSTTTTATATSSSIPKSTVSSAVINQGGMPTALQSAPARCEFRGGIEAYCTAASSVLAEEDGILVVCENSANRNRVVEGAKCAGLEIVEVVGVKGKETRVECLFDVYVMKKVGISVRGDDGVAVAASSIATTTTEISVRDKEGQWTSAYADVLEAMSIPAHNLA